MRLVVVSVTLAVFTVLFAALLSLFFQVLVEFDRV